MWLHEGHAQGLAASVPLAPGAVGMDLALQPMQGSTECLVVGAEPPGTTGFASHPCWAGDYCLVQEREQWHAGETPL